MTFIAYSTTLLHINSIPIFMRNLPSSTTLISPFKLLHHQLQLIPQVRTYALPSMGNLSQENIIFHFLVFLSILFAQTKGRHLDIYYYAQTCPQAERIIREVVHQATMRDSKVAPRLLRMFFHDCFVRVCQLTPPHLFFLPM